MKGSWARVATAATTTATGRARASTTRRPVSRWWASTCHKTLLYKDAPRDCASCHRKDDAHKLTFGTACESCHNARAWGLWTFDHTRRTKYTLDGAHAKVPCARCHTQPAPGGKAAAEVGTNCIGCHRGDDAHDGAFGPACEQCHTSDNWKRIRSRVGQLDHQRLAWALGRASLLSDGLRPEGVP
jgi:hypothetical protein